MNRAVRFRRKVSGVSGHDVLRAIKNDGRTRAIHVVVLTFSNHEQDLAECYQHGVNSYIRKAVDLQKFREALRRFGVYWLMVNQALSQGAFHRASGGSR